MASARACPSLTFFSRPEPPTPEHQAPPLLSGAPSLSIHLTVYSAHLSGSACAVLLRYFNQRGKPRAGRTLSLLRFTSFVFAVCAATPTFFLVLEASNPIPGQFKAVIVIPTGWAIVQFSGRCTARHLASSRFSGEAIIILLVLLARCWPRCGSQQVAASTISAGSEPYLITGNIANPGWSNGSTHINVSAAYNSRPRRFLRKTLLGIAALFHAIGTWGDCLFTSGGSCCWSASYGTLTIHELPLFPAHCSAHNGNVLRLWSSSITQVFLECCSDCDKISKKREICEWKGSHTFA